MVKRIAVLLTLVFFLATAFRGGWSRLDTDFPNYYTAAIALRHHQPLRLYYDWTWFIRQMDYAGIEHQLGAYTPQTPLTMLPMVPLTALSPIAAKRVWLMMNLAFLGLTIFLLSRVTRFRVEDIWLLAFCGFFSLRTNFLFGQYYIFLLFLMTLAFYFLHRQHPSAAGSLAGAAFGLKLYGGPFLLYFAARRQWRAVAGMIAVTVALAVLVIALFGWTDVHYYLSQVLPRTLEGGSIDPYNPGVATISTMLRHWFVREPELNPDPLRHSPWAFFLLRTLITIALVAFTTVAIARGETGERRAFAWFMIAVVMLSTSTASYSFILLLLPLVLLLDDASPPLTVCLFTLYVLLTFPLPLARLFPKVWLLFALYFVAGWPLLRRTGWRWTAALAAASMLVAFLDASSHMTDYLNEPGQHFATTVATQPGAIFSSFPAVTRDGVFYQSMGTDRYILRWLHSDRNEAFAFNGQVLRPRVAPDGRSIDFELVSGRTSTMMRFDPVSRTAVPAAIAVPADAPVSALSPDGSKFAYESSHNGPTQIWLRELRTGKGRRLTGGACNNTAPAWEPDSRAVIFASDCDRAYGLPALYRVAVPAFEK